MYREGLKGNIREKMVHITDNIEGMSLEELQTCAMRADWIMKTAKEQGSYMSKGKTVELKRHAHRDTAEPMDLDVNTTKFKRLTEKEKRERKRKGLCLYCGESGHFRNDCTVRAEFEKKHGIKRAENYRETDKKRVTVNTTAYQEAGLDKSLLDPKYHVATHNGENPSFL
jgi:hypothetical protein